MASNRCLFYVRSMQQFIAFKLTSLLMVYIGSARYCTMICPSIQELLQNKTCFLFFIPLLTARITLGNKIGTYEPDEIHIVGLRL